MKLLSVVVAALCLLGTAVAEQAVDYGDYRIHYSAFNASMLHPDVAQTHRLPRSRYRGILNITVQKQGDGGWEAVPASVTARAVNPAHQTRSFPMRELRDGRSVYYLGSFPISNSEMLDFDVQVTPRGEPQPLAVRFRQQFFID